MSVRLVDSGWENELRESMRICSGRWLVACPFIKRGVVEDLLNIADLDEITVITRFDMRDFVKGVSDVEALQLLVRAGADVRGMQGLHAKAYVFGDQRAAVTSANLTKKGLTGNVEFGCLSGDPDFVVTCAQRVELLPSAGRPTTEAELKQWAAEVKRILRTIGRDDPLDSLEDHGAPPPDSSLPLNPTGSTTAEDGWLAESTEAFVKFAGTKDDREPLSKSILREITDSGAFAFGSYPIKQGHPRRVNDGATIFMARMTKDPNDHRVIGRAIAIAHDPEVDVASQTDIDKRYCLAQWGYLVRVHQPVFIDGTLGNGVSLSALMDDLDAYAFRRARERTLDGEASVNPRQSLGQQADIELSREGFAWMTEHFQAALSEHGQLDPDVVRNPD